LELTYRGTRLLSNPPPSSGGILIAFALKLLEKFDLGGFSAQTAPYLSLLSGIMDATNKARIEAHLGDANHPDGEILLDSGFVARYVEEVHGHPPSSRGTTHISIIDKDGNMASLTASNGEGCGAVLPVSGFMLNNMLGEEDLNPRGFHLWPEDRRMTSMMAPTALFLPDGGGKAVLGSGGSKRIRTALLQVIVNLTDFGMPIEKAVECPRIHREGECLSVEGGLDPAEAAALVRRFPGSRLWDGLNLYFGGAHSASYIPHFSEVISVNLSKGADA